MLAPRSHRGRATREPPRPGPSQAGAHYHESYNRRRDSLGVASQYGRPTSSIYSQPSPEAAVLAAQHLRRDHGYGYHQRDPLEISPPSSPDIASPRNGCARDVSPMDEPDDMAQASANGYSYGAPAQRGTEPRSSISTMRRERRKNSDAARLVLREKASKERLNQHQHQLQIQFQQRLHGQTAHWNSRPAEPATTDKGPKLQVGPQANASRNGHGTPPDSGPPQQQKDPFGPRVNRRIPTTTSEAERQPHPRPAWQGGSGRMVLAEPLHDAQNAPPLVPPLRNVNRLPSGHNPPPATRGINRVMSPLLSPAQPTTSSGGLNPTTVAPSASRSWSGATASPAVQAPSAPYPSPPPEGMGSPAHSMPSKTPAPPQQLRTTQTQAPPPQQTRQRQALLQPQTDAPDVRDTLNLPSTEKAIRRKAPAGPGHRPQPSCSSSVYSQASQPHTSVTPAPQPTTPEHQSRSEALFGYGTSARIEQAAEAQPSSPATSSALDREQSIMDGDEGQDPRSPPIDNVVKIDMSSPYQRRAHSLGAGAGDSTNKALPKHGPFSTGANSPTTSFSSEFKCLPPAPPEDEAKDRISQLNAKLSALANRRLNINTAIKQMTELMPTDSLLASDAVLRKREAEKRKVEVLKVELAEVERESYELGLKLHRAYKRLDRHAEFEPTTLWIRRITG